MSGNFFAIGKPQWQWACKLGMNPAVAFLVLACGTGRDNATTRWSAKAIQTYTGMGWIRAKRALVELSTDPRIIASVQANGKLRLRKLLIPDEADSLLWLPNSVVTGVHDEASPVAKLRQGQNLEYLQVFIELYGVQDLAGDGGLPRSLVYVPYVSEKICERGPFTVWGFRSKRARYSRENGPLARFDNRRGKMKAVWACLDALDGMGIWEQVDYLAEGGSPDAELLHALTGDEFAREVADAAERFASALPAGYRYAAENFDYVLPVLRNIANPAVVGVYRLVYRPHTQLTAAWFAQHRRSCGSYAHRYRALSAGDFNGAVRAV